VKKRKLFKYNEVDQTPSLNLQNADFSYISFNHIFVFFSRAGSSVYSLSEGYFSDAASSAVVHSFLLYAIFDRDRQSGIVYFVFIENHGAIIGHIL
jgi:hypothetical protein